jgi:hypothetical protein
VPAEPGPVLDLSALPLDDLRARRRALWRELRALGGRSVWHAEEFDACDAELRRRRKEPTDAP